MRSHVRHPFKRLEELVDGSVENGGVLWTCSPCFQHRGMNIEEGMTLRESAAGPHHDPRCRHDVAPDRPVSQGERKRPVEAMSLSEEQQTREIELFAHEWLRHTRKLDQGKE